MSTPVPTVPTPFPTVDVTAKARRNTPVAVVVMPVDRSGDAELGPGADRLDPDAVEAARATGKAGEVRQLPGNRWLVGIGDGEPRDWRRAGAALVRAVDANAAADHDAGRTVSRSLQVMMPPADNADRAAALAVGLVLGGYRFRVTGTRSAPRTSSVLLVVDEPERIAAGVRDAVTTAGATALARDLANMPSNVKDPVWLAGTAARLSSGIPGLATVVRDEAWLVEHGFGGVLAVGGGSATPPRLVELTWRPRGGSRAPHLVFIGKGVTFDTGGISIKPADGMHQMRTDMSGGAAVIAALLAIAAMKLPLRVTGLVPCAENHLSGSAYRPGDVVRHFGGRTTEVTNTDAEGRMLLADALAYAAQRHTPDAMVDVATLTGAMKISLGLRIGGLFASCDSLAARIGVAGERVGEAWWRMPLLADNAEDVRSQIADVRQCPGGPGAIAAALFLREFTGDRPWAHLDIAGPARSEATYDEVVPGGTGFAARTLVRLAADYV